MNQGFSGQFHPGQSVTIKVRDSSSVAIKGATVGDVVSFIGS